MKRYHGRTITHTPPSSNHSFTQCFHFLTQNSGLRSLLWDAVAKFLYCLIFPQPIHSTVCSFQNQKSFYAFGLYALSTLRFSLLICLGNIYSPFKTKRQNVSSLLSSLLRLSQHLPHKHPHKLQISPVKSSMRMLFLYIKNILLLLTFASLYALLVCNL